MGRRSIADIRREEIIQAFYEVVSAKGYGKATIREIAKHAGCSYRMLHHYFANKEELLLAFIEELTKGFMLEDYEKFPQFDTATERLKYVFSVAADPQGRYTLDFVRAWVDAWALAKTHPKVAETLQQIYSGYADLAAKIIRQGIKSGEFRKVPPEITANLIIASAEGIGVLWAVNTKNIKIEKLLKHMPEVWMDYLTPQK